MEGVTASDVIGDYGTQGGGAAGEEIDRLDEVLGSPPLSSEAAAMRSRLLILLSESS